MMKIAEVDPYQMQYYDLLKIITNCRGVKKITLHFMQVTPEVLKAIGRTSVETLVISNCEVKQALDGGEANYFSDRFKHAYLHYHTSLTLDFYPFETQFDCSSSFMKQLQKFSKEFKLSKQTKYFQFLKTVVLLDTPFYSLSPQFESSYDIKYFEIPGYEDLDIDNIKTRPFEEKTSSISTFGFFQSAENNPRKMLAFKYNERLVNILCITNGFIRAQTAVNHKNIDFITIDPTEHEKSYQFFIRNKLPFDLKTRVSFVGCCKSLEVYRKFVQAGYIGLLDQDINEKTVLYTALGNAFDTSPGFTNESNRFGLFGDFDYELYTNWVTSVEIGSLITTIKWIYESPEILAQFDRNCSIFKEYVIICKNMDKRWKNHFSKCKNGKEKIDWEHFIKTGEQQAPSKKRKANNDEGKPAKKTK